jgi:hypothetical protein
MAILLPVHHFEVQLEPPSVGAHPPASALAVVELPVQFPSVPEPPGSTFEYGPFPLLIVKFAVSNDALEIVSDEARTTRVTTPAVIIRRLARMINPAFCVLIIKLS